MLTHIKKHLEYLARRGKIPMPKTKAETALMLSIFALRKMANMFETEYEGEFQEEVKAIYIITDLLNRTLEEYDFEEK